jgi:hypothetical protein
MAFLPTRIASKSRYFVPKINYNQRFNFERTQLLKDGNAHSSGKLCCSGNANIRRFIWGMHNGVLSKNYVKKKIDGLNDITLNSYDFSNLPRHAKVAIEKAKGVVLDTYTGYAMEGIG